jgi:hypothetical protein
MKAYWGSEGMAPRVLDLGTRWRCVISFTSRSLYPQGKSSWYPWDRRPAGPQSRPGRCGEERNSQPLPGLDSPIIQPVAQCSATKPSRFLSSSSSSSSSSLSSSLSSRLPSSVVVVVEVILWDGQSIIKWLSTGRTTRVRFAAEAECLSPPPHPDQLWCVPSSHPKGAPSV